jgi:hypothetical protein
VIVIFVTVLFVRRLYLQLVAKKKTENENFSNVNLVLSICQFIVYLTNLSLVRRFHTEKIVKMYQFYSDSSRFFFLQPTVSHFLGMRNFNGKTIYKNLKNK